MPKLGFHPFFYVERCFLAVEALYVVFFFFTVLRSPLRRCINPCLLHNGVMHVLTFLASFFFGGGRLCIRPSAPSLGKGGHFMLYVFDVRSAFRGSPGPES